MVSLQVMVWVNADEWDFTRTKTCISVWAIINSLNTQLKVAKELRQTKFEFETLENFQSNKVMKLLV